VGPTKRGKGTKLMAMADRFGLPLAVCAASAMPHESQLVAPTLDSRFVAELPQRLIGDRAPDLQQELVMRVLAHGPIQKFHAAATLLQLFESTI
jgi:hypothetical protein